MSFSPSLLLLVFVFTAPFAQAASIGSVADRLWDAYVTDTLSAYRPYGGMQSDCAPRRVAATGPLKGAVVLLHGFTACNQQYFPMASLLAARGFEVLLPSLPGHGANFQSIKKGDKFEIVDMVDLLPANGNGYARLAETIDKIMAASTVPLKLLAGLSVGGAVATWTGYLNQTFDYQLEACPFIGFSDIKVNIAVTLMASNPLTGGIRLGWGPGCENERQQGRAGICQFKAVHLKAVKDFGTMISQIAANRLPQNHKAQYVLVDKDNTVNNDAANSVFEKFTPSQRSKCILPSDVGHSFLSQHDNPEQQKYWLPEVTCKFAEALATQQLLNESTCAVRCTSATCPYQKFMDISCDGKVAMSIYQRKRVLKSLEAGSTSSSATSNGTVSFPCIERCIQTKCGDNTTEECVVGCSKSEDCKYDPMVSESLAPDAASPSSAVNSSQENKALSTAGLAGIVIGASCLVLGAIGIVMFFKYRKEKMKEAAAHQEMLKTAVLSEDS